MKGNKNELSEEKILFYLRKGLIHMGYPEDMEIKYIDYQWGFNIYYQRENDMYRYLLSLAKNQAISIIIKVIQEEYDKMYRESEQKENRKF